MQEATQKYWKLKVYRTKCCYLFLLFSLLIATCTSFAFLNGMVFSVLGHSFERHKWSFVLYIVSFSALKVSFSKLSLAKYHFWHKKTYISCLQLRLHKSVFYKFFCTNLSQVILRCFYTEQRCSIKSFFYGKKMPPEVFHKNFFSNILRHSQENTSAGVSFLIKLQAISPVTLLKHGLKGDFYTYFLWLSGNLQ